MSLLFLDAGNAIIANEVSIETVLLLASAIANPTFYQMNIAVSQRFITEMGPYLFSSAVSSFLASQLGASSVVGLQVRSDVFFSVL